MNSSPVLASCLAFALFFCGCAHKGDMKAMAAPTPMPTLLPTPLAATAPGSGDIHYIVQKGDSLWKIASKNNVLGDSLRWPLLFKGNRDQIMDPDIIEIKQDLTYKASFSPIEVAEAVQKAEETPPYAPHSAPRRPLPLKY